MTLREKTRQVMVGGKLAIGGGAPVSVQTMTKCDTHDVKAVLAQAELLALAGVDLIRVAVPTMKDAEAIREIKKHIPVPLCADIHFDHRLALTALEGGVDKLRLNPGNIGDAEKTRIVVREAKARKVPIRIGVNAGSLDKKLIAKYGHATPEAMVESALGHIQILEDLQFEDIVISLKATDVRMTIEAYRLMAQKKPYPLHVGVTEAGSPGAGTVKSAMGIGILLMEGLGDTIRVSLTAEPREEVRVGWEILRAAGLRQRGPQVISCPTCGRIAYDLIGKIGEIEKRIQHLTSPFTLAVMGCEVNGPGEAKDADLGIAGGGDKAALYKKGKLLRVVTFDNFIDEVVAEAEKLDAEMRGINK